MEVYNGRPENNEGRQDKEIRVYDFLEELGITYERVDHLPAETMEACAGAEKALECSMCKNLLLCNRQKTCFYLLMMPGDKPFKTKDLSAQINSARLSFADGEYMEKFLDITPGSLSVMGLMNDKENDVILLIDEDVLSDDFIGCHPCVNTTSLKIKTSDVTEKIIPATGHSIIRVKL